MVYQATAYTAEAWADVTDPYGQWVTILVFCISIFVPQILERLLPGQLGVAVQFSALGVFFLFMAIAGYKGWPPFNTAKRFIKIKLTPDALILQRSDGEVQEVARHDVQIRATSYEHRILSILPARKFILLHLKGAPFDIDFLAFQHESQYAEKVWPKLGVEGI